MNMKQARAQYRKHVKAHREINPDVPVPISFRAFARWICAGDISATGKLAKICASQAAGRT